MASQLMPISWNEKSYLPILYSCSFRLCVFDADQETSQDEVEQAKGKVDTVDSQYAIASVSVSTGDPDIVVGPAFETLDRPVGQHDP